MTVKGGEFRSEEVSLRSRYLNRDLKEEGKEKSTMGRKGRKYKGPEAAAASQ